MVGGSSAVALAAALAPRSSADEVGVHHAAAFCAHTNEGGEAGWVVRQPPAGGERAGGAARARRTAGGLGAAAAPGLEMRAPRRTSSATRQPVSLSLARPKITSPVRAKVNRSGKR